MTQEWWAEEATVHDQTDLHMHHVRRTRQQKPLQAKGFVPTLASYAERGG